MIWFKLIAYILILNPAGNAVLDSKRVDVFPDRHFTKNDCEWTIKRMQRDVFPPETVFLCEPEEQPK